MDFVNTTRFENVWKVNKNRSLCHHQKAVVIMVTTLNRCGKEVEVWFSGKCKKKLKFTIRSNFSAVGQVILRFNNLSNDLKPGYVMMQIAETHRL